MRCFRCNDHESILGKIYCEGCCQELSTQAEQERLYMEQEQKRWHGKPSSWTYIFFCTRCGIEVYRREHVARRTEKTVREIDQQSRLALFQHVQRVQHSGNVQELRVNERWGDRSLEIPGVEPWTEESERTCASRFMKEFGML